MSYAVVKNALPEQTAETARKIFLNSRWHHVPYKDQEYYGKYPDRTARGLPAPGETYSTDFWKSDSIVEDVIISHYADNLIDVIESRLDDGTKVDRNTLSLIAYRLRPGGHLRIHDDAYTADVGFIWYLSKNWRWDWGGLLFTFSENGMVSAEMPEFNKLVVLNHSIGVTHCVTSVEPWAQDDRYMLVGMMRCIK